MNLLKNKYYIKPKRVKTVYGVGNKKSEENIIKSIRNLFELKKENEAIKDIIIKDIRNLFKQEDNFYMPIRVANSWNNNWIKYESSGNRNKNLSVKGYLSEFKWMN